MARRKVSGVTEAALPDVELVVLLDDNGEPCGSAPKAEVHHANTPRHLAFSCWVVDDLGRTLLTRRAATKRTWPCSWTNAFCGHPAPGEAIADAVHRRARDELGTRISEPVAVLPDFHYRAVMDDGTVENEICPVYVAHLLVPADPNPEEVADLRWLAYSDLPGAIAEQPSAYSPWMHEQLAALLRIGWIPAPKCAREA
jgi:isopentenyl-diphosphate delta-isomerase